METESGEMTSYERVMRAIGGDQPDRVPVIPSIRDWCIRQAGFKFSEVMASPEKYVFSQYYCLKEFKYDAVWDLYSVHAESEAMGSSLIVKGDLPPSIKEPVVKDYRSDLVKLKIPNPYRDGRLPQMLEIIQRLKDLCGEDTPVIGYVQGPFRNACMLRGMENVSRDLFKNPEGLKDLLEISLTSLVSFGLAVVHAGADIISISEPTCSGDVISRKSWEAFGFPYVKRLVQELKKTRKPILFHVCGDTSDRLDSFLDLGVDILSLDQKVDFKYARAVVGDKACLMGNVDPTGTLLFGDPVKVKKESEQVIQKAGLKGSFILSSGCAVPPDTPKENLKAMVDTARHFGAYPIRYI